MLSIPSGTIVQFAHDTLFLSVVRLKNGQPVLGLTSRPTNWTIPFAATVNGLPNSLKLMGTSPSGNRETQWVRQADDLIHVAPSADQNAFVINFVNGSSSACTLMAGSSPDSFFGIRPLDGKFVVHIVSARPEATRFNIALPSFVDHWRHGERDLLQARYPLV